jgi:ribosome-associated protein
MSAPLVVNPHVTIPAHELTWSAARAGGPGGQNVNKVASKVELRFDLARTAALDP